VIGRGALVIGVALALVACSDDSESSAPSTTSTATTEPGVATGIAALCPGFEVPEPQHSVALARPLPDGPPEARAAAALEALAAGITDEEEATGVLVPWPDGADVLAGIELEGDHLTIDFRDTVIGSYVLAPGTAHGFVVPLIETALQEPTIERISIVIDGSADAFVNWSGADGEFDRASWRERNAGPEPECPPPSSGG
jgi:Sporulation and spore germination